MEDLGDELRQYIVAMSDPTRAAILLELEQAGELTATQLARRLDLTANNVYHHMRVLRRLGVLEAPRVAARETYVEKYYRLKPALAALVAQDPDWMDRTQDTMSAEDRKALLIGMCLTMAHILQRAARRYAAMDTVELDRLSHQQAMTMVSINHVSRGQLIRRLAEMRTVLRQEHDENGGSDENAPATDIVLMAGLPLLRAETR